MIVIQTPHDCVFEVLSSLLEDRGYPCIRYQNLIQDCDCFIWDVSYVSLPSEILYSRTPLLVLGSFLPAGLPSSVCFLKKPLKFLDLLTACEKIEVLKRRTSFVLGPYEILLKMRQAIHQKEGTVHILTEKEVAILEVLFQEVGIVEKETLLLRVWGYGADIDTHTLETHIYKLRKKLFPDSSEEFIITAPKGYSLRL